MSLVLDNRELRSAIIPRTAGDCGNCPLKNKVKVFGEGNPRADILIVGQGPGYYEIILKRPFVGKSGRKLDNILARVGLRRSDLYLTNAFLCRGEDDSEVPAAAVNCCRERLVHEIKTIKPKVIVCLGLVSAKSLLGVRSLKHARGKIVDFNGAKVVVTVHPAKVLREWGLEVVLETDLRKAMSLLKQSKVKETHYQTITSVKQVAEVCEYLAASGTFAVDAETEGYDFTTDELLCCQFSCKKAEAFCIPLLGYKSAEIWSKDEKRRVINYIRGLLASNAEKVGANIKFDLHFFHRVGVFESDAMLWDVILMHHLLNENLPHALDAMVIEMCEPFFASEHSFISDYVRTFAPKDSDSFSEVPPNLLHYYACSDADGSMRTYDQLRPRLRQENLEKLYVTLVYPMILAVGEMERRGLVLDVEKIKQASKILQKQISEKQSKLYEAAGKKFNPRSTVQLREVFEKLGVRSNKLTKKGNVSWDKSVLESLQHESELAKELLGLRQIEKLKGTYLDGRTGDKGLLRRIRSDGRIHPSFLIHGTRSGRLSSARPNFQNIPGEPPEVRQIFTVEKGWNFISADYEKAELNVVARLAGDKALIERLKADYEQGLDFHTGTALDVGLTPKGRKPTDRQRFNAKMICVTGDALIPTSKGFQPIRELRKGDFVHQVDGNLQTITKLVKLKSEVYEYLLSSGSIIRCTANHPFYVIEHGKLAERPASSLKPGSYVLQRRGTFVFGPGVTWNSDSFSGKTCYKPIWKGKVEVSKDLAYLAGLVLAEGTFYPNTISIENTDRKIKKFLNYLMKSAFKGRMRKCPGTSKNGVRWNIDSVQFIAFLNWLGLKKLNKRKGQKTFPWRVLQLKKGEYLSFLAGYLDGDGDSLYKGLSCSSVSKSICNGISLMFQNIGANTSLATYVPKKRYQRVYGILAKGDVTLLSSFLKSEKWKQANVVSARKKFLQGFNEALIKCDLRGAETTDRTALKLNLGKQKKISYQSIKKFELYRYNKDLAKCYELNLSSVKVRKITRGKVVPVFDYLADGDRSLMVSNVYTFDSFASIYGSSARSLALRLGLPDRSVQRHFDKFSAKYPKVKEFADKQQEIAAQDTFTLTNVFGRKRRFYGLHSTDRETRSKATRQATNNPVSSASSDILSYATGRIHKRQRGMRAGLIGSLHDSIFAEAPDDEVDEVLLIMKEEMEKYVKELDYYPKVDIKVSDRWNGEIKRRVGKVNR